MTEAVAIPNAETQAADASHFNWERWRRNRDALLGLLVLSCVLDVDC